MHEENQIQIKRGGEDDFRNILERLYLSQQLALIYTNTEETDKFFAGYVNQIFSNQVIINNISPYGKYDGFCIKMLEDIYRVETESQYAKKIEILSQYYNVNHDAIEMINDNGIVSLLNYAKKYNKIVSIGLLQSEFVDVVGFIEEIDLQQCRIREIDQYGLEDGVCTIKIEDITYMSCDGEEEFSRSLLYDMQRKEKNQ